MARLSEVPKVIRRIGVWTFLKRIWQQVDEDNVFTWGAALAYSWLFALFPFIVFLVSLVPLLPDRFKPNIEEASNTFLEQTASPYIAEQLKPHLTALMNTRKGGFFSLSLLLTIYAASKGMAMTMSAIDKAYDIEKGRPFWKQKPLAMLLTIIVATMVVLVLILLPIGAGVVHWLKQQGAMLNWSIVAVNILRYAMAILLMFTILAIIYHFGPSFKQSFIAVTPGAFFTVAVWLGMGLFFRFYLVRLGGAATYLQTYGTIAGAAVLLLLFYFDAVVLLIGAEINSEIDFELRGAPEGAVR